MFGPCRGNTVYILGRERLSVRLEFPVYPVSVAAKEADNRGVGDNSAIV
jgi:hypothetical protein